MTFALSNYVAAPLCAQNWQIFGELSSARHNHAAFPISENQILVIGGYGNSVASSSGTPLSSCEIIDLERRRIIVGPRMNVPRAEFAALTLPDGDIVVIGGVTDTDGQKSASIERYSIADQSWTEIGSLEQARSACHAELLNSEQIVIVGGRIAGQTVVNSFEVFDIPGRTIVVRDQIGSPVVGGVMARPGNDRPIIVGGRTGGPGSLRSGQIIRFNGGTNWETSPLQFWDDAQGAYLPQVLELWSGEVLVSGGVRNETPISFRTDLVSINADLTPQTVANMPVERTLHSMIQLNDQRILITGGRNQAGATLAQTDYFDLQDGNWTYVPGPRLRMARRYGIGVSIPERDGNGAVTNARAVLIGGFRESSNLASVEILEEDESNRAPVVYNIVETCTSLTFCVADPNNVVQIANEVTANVNLSTDTILSTKVTVTVTLGEAREPNAYDIRIVNALGNETQFGGVIDFRILPEPSITAPKDGICLGETIELGVDEDFESYLWSNGAVTSTIEVSPTVSTEYTVELVDAGGCVATTSPFTLQVFSPPPVPNLIDDTPSFTLCEGSGDSLVLSVATLYDNYAWYVDDQLVSNDPILVVKESSSVYLEVGSGPGCIVRSETIFINVTGDRLAFPTLDNGRHFMDCSAAAGSVYCEEFPVVNLSDQILSLDRQSVRSFGNAAFSLPLGQFSAAELKQIPAGASAMLTVCYAPRRLGFSKVDVLVSGNCNVTAFEIVCSGISPRNFTGLSNCNVAVTAVTAGFSLPPIGEAILSPNPASTLLEIDVDLTEVMVDAFVPDAVITDVLGRILMTVPPRQLMVHVEPDSDAGADGSPQRHIANYSADVRHLPSGMYHLIIPGLHRSFLLAVEH